MQPWKDLYCNLFSSRIFNADLSLLSLFFPEVKTKIETQKYLYLKILSVCGLFIPVYVSLSFSPFRRERLLKMLWKHSNLRAMASPIVPVHRRPSSCSPMFPWRTPIRISSMCFELQASTFTGSTLEPTRSMELMASFQRTILQISRI